MFQIATLRIFANLLFSNPHNLWVDFFNGHGSDSVVLFCLHCTLNLIDLDTLQVFFDLITFRKDILIHVSKLSVDVICQPTFLSLLIDIGICLPQKAQVACIIVDWLINMCNDCVENSAIVLDTIGLTPLLTMISLWTTNQNSTVQSAINFDEIAGSKKLKLVDQMSLSTSSANNIRYKLQYSTSKLLLILLGSPSSSHTGNLPGSAAVVSISGFNSNHMSTLLTFVQDAVRQGDADIFDSNYDKFEHYCEVDEIRKLFGQSTLEPETNFSARAWLLHSAYLVLNVILNSLDGPFSNPLNNILKMALPINVLWGFVIDLVGCSQISIRVSALRMLGISLSAFDGTVQ